jgi:hypothetical protein
MQDLFLQDGVAPPEAPQSGRSSVIVGPGPVNATTSETGSGRGIVLRVARCGIEPSTKLGRHR